MREKRFYLEIFLVSLAAILLEISYTRVFSFKLFYYFSYLVIGISLLGIGAGGVAVAVSKRLRRVQVDRLIPICCVVGGSVVAIGYVVIADLQLNAFRLAESPIELLKLAVICTFLFTPFLMAGLIIATLFGTRPGDINRLYCADLAGAGLGCVSCVPLIYTLTPPGCIFLSGFLFVATGMRLAATSVRPLLRIGVPISLVLLAVALRSSVLPDPIPDAVKTMSPQRAGASEVLFSRWSPVFRVDVSTRDKRAARYIINHDGTIGSVLNRFDGNIATQGRFDSDVRSYPFRVLKPNPKVLIIGSAGGHEILASLYFGAVHITAVELNPVTVSLLTTYFADFSGHLPQNPRVTLLNDEGRSYMSRDRSKYDLIWFVAPDSYSAMNAATAGAYVLSESYLYTEEMIEESLRHLTPDGVICMQFGEVDFERKPNRTSRYLGTARAAFRAAGIPDFGKHVLVGTVPAIATGAVILLKASEFTPGEIQRFVQNAQAVTGSKIRYVPGDPSARGPVSPVITLPDAQLQQWYAAHRYDVRPITDDSPFFWHFARFTDAIWGADPVPGSAFDMEDAKGERVLVILLAFVVLFAGTFLLLPFVAIRSTWAQIPYKGYAAVYFAALGLGFMFFEISLIQKLTLFLGYPTYSLTVTLFALLVFTGLGSLASGAYHRGQNRTLMVLLACLSGLMLFYEFGLSPAINAFVGAPLPVRIALAITFIAPLGLILGTFMPVGLQRIAAVTEYRQEFIAWSWAVNGFFSVASSILTTILSMVMGFRLVMFVAVVVYAAGILSLTRIPAVTDTGPRRSPQP